MPEDILNGGIMLKNNYYYTSLDDFTADWQIEGNGITVDSGKFSALHIAPGDSASLT